MNRLRDTPSTMRDAVARHLKATNEGRSAETMRMNADEHTVGETLAERADKGAYLLGSEVSQLAKEDTGAYSRYLDREKTRLAARPWLGSRAPADESARAGPRFGKVTTAIVLALRGRPSAFSMLATAVAIATHVNAHTGTAWPSLATLAKEVGTTPKSISKAIQGLIGLGIVKRRRRQRKSSEYTVNLDPPASVEFKGRPDLTKLRLDSPSSMRPDSSPVVKQTEKGTPKDIEQGSKETTEVVEGFIP